MTFNNDSFEKKRLNNETTIENAPSRKKWTLYLILCCITVSLFSFQFGYNIASLNSPTDIIKDFIRNHLFLFKEYHSKAALFNVSEQWLIGNETKFKNSMLDLETKKSEYVSCTFAKDIECVKKIDADKENKTKILKEKHNVTIDEFIEFARNKLIYKRKLLEENRIKLANATKKVNFVTGLVWTILNCIFVVGGMIGAFTSKYVLDIFGRKVGLVLNGLFSIAGGILVVMAPYVNSPVCVIVSRFLFGIQGGMACSLVPTYLSEISPPALRGRTGVMAQLNITAGILFGQILGFRQVLGSRYAWQFLLAFPMVIGFVAIFLLILFFYETPKALIMKNNDYQSARKALEKLRNNKNVDEDIQEIYDEEKLGLTSATAGLFSIFANKELRWPLITSICIHGVQQLCGINAIFFYSSSIFKDAGIPGDYIQYAIASTGIVNVLATILCVPLIDKLGRKPLLVYPMLIMIVDFIVLTFLLVFKSQNYILSYISIFCIIVFVVCFAIGLGPIPFIYTAEVFRQNSRSSAMAISLLVNWTSGLALTILFPLIQQILQEYVFLVFLVVVLLGFLVIFFKMPETKGKHIEDILYEFNG